MTWLTVTQYLCHNDRYGQFVGISTGLFPIHGLCHRVSKKSNMAGATGGVGTAFRTNEFTPCFSAIHIAQSMVFCVMFCRSVCPFVLFLLAIVFSVLLRVTTSDYLFSIFKLFLTWYKLCLFYVVTDLKYYA